MDLIKNLYWLIGKDKNLIIIREEPDLGFGYNPWERPPEIYIRYGIVNLDKPPGPTSHQVTTWVKTILGVSKTGHGGTLDPMVTGVLPIGLEKGTLVMRYIVGSIKEYIGLMKLHGDVDQDKIQKVFNLFKGRIYQRPPVRSSVRRKLRSRTVYDSKIIEIDGRNILFWIKCESGFYVRKYVHDMGLVLGVGAHLAELRRIRAGPFSESEYLTNFYQLYAAYHLWEKWDNFVLMRKTIVPLEYVFKNFPLCVVKDTAVASIIYGGQLKAPGIIAYTSDLKKNKRVALVTKKGELVGVAISVYDSNELKNIDRGIVAKTERVIMEKGIYPPLWRRSSKN